MVQIFNTLLETALDANGNPVSGAQLFVYEAGTTTKLTTYTDSALTVPAANPLVADSAGRFATLYGAADDYKFVLTSSTDTDPPVSPVKTLDNYTISAATSFSGGINTAGYSEHVANAQTGTSYTMLTGDRAKVVTFSNASSVAVTIPQANSTTFADGWYFYTQNLGVGNLVFTPTTSTINGASSLTLIQGQGALIESNGTNYNVVVNEINPVGPAINISSNTTTDLGSLASNFANITGTTTITSFGSSALVSNPLYIIKFAGILTLTYNGTSLITPNAANITTAAGDTAIAEYLDSGNWKIHSYHSAEIGALATVSSAADTVPYFTGAGTAAVTTLSSFGRTLIDDANAAAALATLGIGTEQQSFTTSDTWTKPSTGVYARVQVWGAGGGGANAGTTNCGGGGGGSYKEGMFLLSSLGATETITIGAGGTGGTGSSNGTNGGSSSFGSWITAYGGTGGNTATNGGAAGGLFATATAGATANDYVDGDGGSGGSAAGGNGYYTGGGGGAGTGGIGGSSVYGGGGGSGGGAIGSSVFGGDGGAVTGGNGTAPAGGGARGNNTTPGGDGADGKIIVSVW